MGPVGAGYASSGHEKPFDSARKETSVRQVIRLAILDFLLGLSCTGRIVYVHDELCLVHYNVPEPAS